MTLATIGGLVVLALVDSTSVGTLLLPIWLMLAPGRVRPGRILVFLSAVAAFYLALGLLLVAGLSRWADDLSALLATTPAQVAQVGVGAVLVAAALWIGRDRAPSGRLLAWRERVVGESSSIRSLVAVALTAAVIEAASMVPYLAAIGIIGTADLSTPSVVAVLTGYCLVMVLPAVVLLGLRIGAARAVEPTLRRVDAWMQRTGRENTAWIVGIIGFFVAVSALDALGVIGVIDRIGG